MSPLKADTVLSKDGKLVFSAGREQSPLAPVPSSELREAIVSFRAALQCAVDVVQAREKVNTALDVAEKESNEVCSREDSNAEETELDSAEKEAYGEADCGNTDEKDAEKDAE